VGTGEWPGIEPAGTDGHDTTARAGDGGPVPPPALTPTPPWSSAPSPAAPGPPRRPGSRGALAVTVGLGCAALVAAAVVAVAASSREGEQTAPDPVGEAEPADDRREAEAGSPEAAFAGAAARLRDAGTFHYTATSHVEAADPVGGGRGFTVNRDLEGEVALPDSVRESLTIDDRQVYEWMATGSGTSALAWTRESAFPDEIASRPWGETTGSTGELDLLLLPGWLDGAVGHRDGGEDAAGRPVVEASLPGRLVNDLGPDMAVIDAEIELTLDDDGAPRKVALLVSSTDTVIDSTYTLSDLGAPVAIERPDAAALDATPWINEQDLAMFDGPAPLGLGSVPTGWELSGAYVTPDWAPGCDSATVDYTDFDDTDGSYLWIDVYDAACATDAPGAPFEAGGYAGTMADVGDGTVVGTVMAGDVAVDVTTDLSVADLGLVLASLGPFDPAATPVELPGIPSSGD
jgi:hypothetical protein